MPIKKSELEEKWYYRVTKIFFWLLPLLVAAIFLLNAKIDISDITQKGIADILQKNINLIIYIVVGIILYFIILRAIWRIFLYIVFGGLQDDSEKKNDKATQPANQTAQLAAPAIIITVILAIALLANAGYIKLPKIDINSGHTYGAACTSSEGKGLYGTNGICYTCSGSAAMTKPTGNNCSSGLAGVYCCGAEKNDGCISTGCGSMFYCSGSYYYGGQEIRVNDCSVVRYGDLYSSWSGTCRQCP